VLVTDESGQQVWSAEYTPFGKQVSKEGELDRAAKFAGKDLDEDTRLYYFNARWYDQETGRFISEDPKFDPNNPNLYWYCDNNPLTNVDLDGRETTRADQKVFDKWFSVWTTINNNAVNSERTQRQAIWKQDPVGFADRMYDYKMGKRDVFGKQYLDTVNVIQTTTAMMSAAPKVQDWIENQISNGHTPTFEEINHKANEIAKTQEAFDTYVAPVLYSAIGWAQMAAAGKQGVSNNTKISEEVTGNSGADNIATGPKLRAQLIFEEANSIFTESGTLKPEVIKNSRAIISGNELKNPDVINALTKNGSNISDWAKMSTETFKSPSGDFQVHFYQNIGTGEVSTYEMKVKFNN
jgi:RHS repeat-associated protein